MKILLTLDYELFNGSVSGTVENSLLIPTKELSVVLRKHKVNATYFIDTCFLNRLKQLSDIHKEVKDDYERIIDQLHYLVKQGDEIQLHIHPNWINAKYNGNYYIGDINYYKLSDIDDDKVNYLFKTGIKLIEQISGGGVYAFRAGAYCIQTLPNYSAYFAKYGIRIDSSVYRGHKETSKKRQNFDYTKIPNKLCYRFNTNVCDNVENGQFVELSIPTFKVDLIYMLVRRIKRRLRKKKIIRWGDGKGGVYGTQGNFVTRIKKFKLLTKPYLICASIDNDNDDLEYLYKIAQRRGDSYFLIMGHPKSFTDYSLNQLDLFLSHHSSDEVITISKCINYENIACSD